MDAWLINHRTEYKCFEKLILVIRDFFKILVHTFVFKKNWICCEVKYHLLRLRKSSHIKSKIKSRVFTMNIKYFYLVCQVNKQIIFLIEPESTIHHLLQLIMVKPVFFLLGRRFETILQIWCDHWIRAALYVFLYCKVFFVEHLCTPDDVLSAYVGLNILPWYNTD